MKRIHKPAVRLNDEENRMLEEITKGTGLTGSAILVLALKGLYQHYKINNERITIPTDFTARISSDSQNISHVKGNNKITQIKK